MKAMRSFIVSFFFLQVTGGMPATRNSTWWLAADYAKLDKKLAIKCILIHNMNIFVAT